MRGVTQTCVICSNPAYGGLSEETKVKKVKGTISVNNLCGVHLEEAKRMGVEDFLEKHSGYNK